MRLLLSFDGWEGGEVKVSRGGGNNRQEIGGRSMANRCHKCGNSGKTLLRG